MRVLVHVADRIEVHERRDRGHDDQHHRRQRVDAERPVDVEVARRDPVADDPDDAAVRLRRSRPAKKPIQDSSAETTRAARW